MLHWNDEECGCDVTAAAEHTACPSSTQRRRCQSEGQVEHDTFPPGDKVYMTHPSDMHIWTHLYEQIHLENVGFT